MSSDTGSNDDTLESIEGVDYETPLSTPRSIPPLGESITHDTSRAKYHMKDLESFAASLEDSAKRAFPNRGQSAIRYKNVQVLLLRWAEDDLGVAWEVEDLEKTFKSYGFNAETWLIPSENSHLKLMLKAGTFVEDHENTDTLFIVYYGGHATINRRRQSTWSCKRDLTYATLEWSAIQIVFEKAKSDVLLLLDCCSAASAAPIAGRAITETIAACGWESIAAEPGRFSFTDTLIKVLEEWINRPFTAAMLHCEMLSRLKHENPELMGSQRVEIRRTPIYIVTTGDLGASSIYLAKSQHALNVSREELVPKVEAISAEIEDIDKISETSVDGTLKTPHVLISLALEENQILDAQACSRWLASFPALSKYAKVQSVFKSHSTLLLVSLPVSIWDLLPENPACSFIGYTCSNNLLDTSIKAQESGLADIREENILLRERYNKLQAAYLDLRESLEHRKDETRHGRGKSASEPYIVAANEAEKPRHVNRHSPWIEGLSAGASGNSRQSQGVEVSQKPVRTTPMQLPLLIVPEISYKRGSSHDLSPFHSSVAGSIYSNTSSEGPRNDRLWAPSRSTSISTLTDRSTPISMSHWSPIGVVNTPQDYRSPSFESMFEYHIEPHSSPNTATPKMTEHVARASEIFQQPPVTTDFDNYIKIPGYRLGISRGDNALTPSDVTSFASKTEAEPTPCRLIHITSPHAIGWTVKIKLDPDRDENWISPRVVEELKLPIQSGSSVQSIQLDGHKMYTEATVRARWYDPSRTPSCQYDSKFYVAPMDGPFEVIFGRKLISTFGDDEALPPPQFAGAYGDRLYRHV